MNKPTVTILTLGGTIAMTSGDGEGVVPTLTGDSLVAAVPSVGKFAHIDVQSFRQLPSAQLQFIDLEELAATIQALSERGRQGIVITQGTDTIEETAFALDRLLDLETPVVITGAMRNPTVPGADGPGNLLAAVQVAVSKEARGCGCLVVMNDEVHAARFVRKTHTSRLDAFSSPLCGRIGWVTEGRVYLCVRPIHIPALSVTTTGNDARVALATMALGDNGDLIQAILPTRPTGLVIEATGGGHVSSEMADALEEAAEQMLVVLTSRTGAGDTLAQTYGFLGSEIDLQRRGLIRGGWLDGLKAKVLLTLLLRHGIVDKKAVRQAFRPWGGG